MKFIEGARGSGKTTKLIYKSAELNIPIIAPTTMMCNCIKARASEIGCNIPEPISINKLINIFTRKEKYLIDELDLCLEQLGIDAEYASITVNNDE